MSLFYFAPTFIFAKFSAQIKSTPSDVRWRKKSVLGRGKEGNSLKA